LFIRRTIGSGARETKVERLGGCGEELTVKRAGVEDCELERLGGGECEGCEEEEERSEERHGCG